MLNFVVIKFFAMALNASRSLILAAILGPPSYGVLGTLILVQQYLSFASLGMREGVTVTLARLQEPGQRTLQVYGSALAWASGIGLIVLAVLLAARSSVDGMSQYLGWIGALSLLSIVNEILINIHRDQNRLKQIALLEVLYNAVPLGVALWLWRNVTIEAVLAALTVGLLLSVIFFVNSLPRVKPGHVQWPVMKELVGLGIPLATLSALTLLANSMYVILANRMALGDTVGLVVFANAVCTMVLFTLNAAAWAATSRSMRQLYAEQPSQTEQMRAERLSTAFRLGLTVAAFLCLSMAAVFVFVLKAYAGAEVFAFYFCLLQAYGLLLFDEINQLIVSGRSKWVVAGYGALVTLVFAVHATMPQVAIQALILVGIGGYFALAVAAVAYCSRLRVPRQHDWHRLVFLFFPIGCAMLYLLGGTAGALLTCLGFAALALHFHRARVVARTRHAP